MDGWVEGTTHALRCWGWEGGGGRRTQTVIFLLGLLPFLLLFS